MKLYSVTSLVKEYRGCKDVLFHWFLAGPPHEPRPYAKLIAGYTPGADWENEILEQAVDDLFTEDQAQALKAYLDDRYGGGAATSVAEVALPIDNNRMAVSALPVGGGIDSYIIDRELGYSLPFRAGACFDLRGY